jgi:hypothetical protein
MAENESRVLTILLTDIRNFTDRTSHSSMQGGHGKIINCLWSHWDQLGKRCQQASLPFWRKAAGLNP